MVTLLSGTRSCCCWCGIIVIYVFNLGQLGVLGWLLFCCFPYPTRMVPESVFVILTTVLSITALSATCVSYTPLYALDAWLVIMNSLLTVLPGAVLTSVPLLVSMMLDGAPILGCICAIISLLARDCVYLVWWYMYRNDVVYVDKDNNVYQSTWFETRRKTWAGFLHLAQLIVYGICALSKGSPQHSLVDASRLATMVPGLGPFISPLIAMVVAAFYGTASDICRTAAYASLAVTRDMFLIYYYTDSRTSEPKGTDNERNQLNCEVECSFWWWVSVCGAWFLMVHIYLVSSGTYTCVDLPIEVPGIRAMMFFTIAYAPGIVTTFVLWPTAAQHCTVYPMGSFFFVAVITFTLTAYLVLFLAHLLRKSQAASAVQPSQSINNNTK